MHYSLIAVLNMALAVSASPLGLVSKEIRGSIEARDVIKPLPAKADDIEKKFQPLMDFDTDGCYNTAAIDPSGKINPGLDPAKGIPSAPCRSPSRLENNNVYSRKKCDKGKCAILYEYYFEKDDNLGGHRHDWENVIVFTNGDKVERVATSCHADYTVIPATSASYRADGTHPKVVYHRSGLRTHCIRHAKAADDKIENYTGKWFRGPLVGWEGYPSIEVREKLLSSWVGGLRPKLAENEFDRAVANANKRNSGSGSSRPSRPPM